jgi:hypothetical protein
MKGRIDLAKINSSSEKFFSWNNYYQVSEDGTQAKQLEDKFQLESGLALIMMVGNSLVVPPSINLQPNFKLYDRFNNEVDSNHLTIVHVTEEEFQRTLQSTIDHIQNKQEPNHMEKKEAQPNQPIVIKERENLRSTTTEALLKKLIEAEDKYKESLSLERKIAEGHILDEIAARKKQQKKKIN